MISCIPSKKNEGRKPEEKGEGERGKRDKKGETNILLPQRFKGGREM